MSQVQFLIVFVHTIQIQFQPSCAFPAGIGALLSLNAGIFTYMFSAFYVRSYNRKPTAAKAKVQAEICANGGNNNVLADESIAAETDAIEKKKSV